MNSPFSDRGMITDPNRFFGRAAETQKIFNALAGPKPQCVSIIGERRIGRSSLLQHILRSYPQHLPQPDRYRFAYLDLARDTCGYPEQFYAEVAQAFGGNVTNELSPQQFDDWLSNQNPQRAWRYIILLDEFNALQRRREQFGDDFYDGLRSRANAGEITFVLASHIPLHEIALANNFSSTFFGIFTPVDLKEFSYKEARASTLRPVATPLRLEDFNAFRHWVRDNDSGTYHPLKLNIAADLVWQALPKPNYGNTAKVGR
ncbi:MAG: ATP-binding protein [Chloroflexi bacterium]|nr:ATP-binding protein [Chloroflexota bacterium]